MRLYFAFLIATFAAWSQEPFNLMTTFPTGVGTTSATLRGQVTSYGQATQCLFGIMNNGSTIKTEWIQIPAATDIAYVSKIVTGLVENSSVTVAIECIPFGGGASVIGSAYTFQTGTGATTPTTLPTPTFDPNKIVAAGSPTTTGISPYAIVSIFGSNLATQTVTAPAGQLTTTLGGTSVSFSGIPGYPMYVSPTQINVLVPSTMPTLTSINIQVNVDAGGGNVKSGNGWVVSQEYSPSIFRYTGVAGNDLSAGQQLALVNGKRVVILYGTGFGLANDATTGAIAPTLAVGLTSLPEGRFVDADGRLWVANVTSATLASGQIGVDQINAEIPMGITLGPGSLRLIARDGHTVTVPVNVQ